MYLYIHHYNPIQTHYVVCVNFITSRQIPFLKMIKKNYSIFSQISFLFASTILPVNTLIPRFVSPRSASASKLLLFKVSVISKLRRFCFSLHRMFPSCVVSASICVVNTKKFVQS